MDKNMPFEKGKSGNPRGRPKHMLPDGRSLAELCREHTATAVNALIDIASGEVEAPAAARVSAASAIIDRGWGKAPQAVEVTGADGGPVQYEEVNAAADEFSRVIAAMAARNREGSASH